MKQLKKYTKKQKYTQRGTCKFDLNEETENWSTQDNVYLKVTVKDFKNRYLSLISPIS